MLTSTAFTVVVVDHQCPGLFAGLEALGNVGNSVRISLVGVVIMVESDVYVATFVVHSLVWNVSQVTLYAGCTQPTVITATICQFGHI